MRAVEREIRHIEAMIRQKYPGAEYIELEPMGKDSDKFAIDDSFEEKLFVVEKEEMQRLIRVLYEKDEAKRAARREMELQANAEPPKHLETTTTATSTPGSAHAQRPGATPTATAPTSPSGGMNVLEVTVMEEGGSALDGHKTCFFPCHKVVAWLHENCKTRSRTKHILSCLKSSNGGRLF